MVTTNRSKIYKIYKSITLKTRELPVVGDALHFFFKLIKKVALHLYTFFVSNFMYIFPAKYKNNQHFQDNQLLSISPADIFLISDPVDEERQRYHPVRGGNWDLRPTRFEKSGIYLALLDIILKKTSMEETDYYKESIQRIKRGNVVWNSVTEDGFKLRFEKLLTQDFSPENIPGAITQENNQIDTIRANIDRKGRFVVTEGVPPVAVSKILGIDKIPVLITTRHLKWVQFKKRYELLATDIGARTYQPSAHPDLSYIPSIQSSAERFKIIKENMSCMHGELLDLGANLGYFTINFENLGFNCVAVENFPPYIFCLKGQKNALCKNFVIITESLLDSKKILNKSYDVVLALNIFFHFFYRKRDFQKLESFLEHLNCKEMYFEPHQYTDPQLRNAYINMHEDEYVDFVKTKLRLKNAQLIGKATDNRSIFRIY